MEAGSRSCRESAGAMGADDHTRGEKGENDEREEVDDVARVEDTLLDAFEVRHHAEGGDGVDEPGTRPMDEKIRDGWIAGQDQEEREHHRDDEGYDLIPGHGGG